MRNLLLICSLFPASLAQAITVEIFMQQQPVCNHAIGQLNANVTGGNGPYAYDWSTGETTYNIGGLAAGTYSVIVTDANSETATAEFTLEALPAWEVGMGSHPYCAGQSSYGHVAAGYLTGGYDPFTYSLDVAFPLVFDGPYMQVINANTAPAWMGYSYILDAAPGWYTINFTDATGCPGVAQGEVLGAVEWPIYTQLDAAPSCGPTPNGTITAFRTGGSYAAITGPGATIWDTGLDEQEIFYDVPPGGHWLVQTTRTPGPNSANWEVLPAAQCADSTYVVVADAGPGCGQLSGTVHVDADQDCILDGGELLVANRVVILEPGPHYASTDAQGNYSADLPVGTYALSIADDLLTEACPTQATIVSLVVPVVADLPTQSQTPESDVLAFLISGPARPGFQLIYFATAKNLTYNPTGAVAVTFTFDAITSFVSADPMPDTDVGQTLTWNLPALAPFEQVDLEIRVLVPADVGLIGTDLLATFSAQPALLDGDLGNNTMASSVSITGSFDPNDKLAATSTRESETLYFINEDEWIDYTIRFQNTGTDTAFNVVITDTLPSTLDPSTFIPGAAAHARTWEMEEDGMLRFTFNNILLPDSNVNEPESHGFVSFRIKPRLPLAPTTEIENTANIFFDFNPPVITEPSVLVAEFSTGVAVHVPSNLSLAPVPVNDQLSVSSAQTIERITILAADGRVVEQMSVRGVRGTIDVKGLTGGAYLLIAELSNGTTVRERFIKQ